ncbi:MAG: hypothetical protein JWP34_4498, partial [Massilia sp.]|nr:hypothetical protein [Massilia sp.]
MVSFVEVGSVGAVSRLVTLLILGEEAIVEISGPMV